MGWFQCRIALVIFGTSTKAKGGYRTIGMPISSTGLPIQDAQSRSHFLLSRWKRHFRIATKSIIGKHAPSWHSAGWGTLVVWRVLASYYTEHHPVSVVSSRSVSRRRVPCWVEAGSVTAPTIIPGYIQHQGRTPRDKATPARDIAFSPPFPLGSLTGALIPEADQGLSIELVDNFFCSSMQ